MQQQHKLPTIVQKKIKMAWKFTKKPRNQQQQNIDTCNMYFVHVHRAQRLIFFKKKSTHFIFLSSDNLRFSFPSLSSSFLLAVFLSVCIFLRQFLHPFRFSLVFICFFYFYHCILLHSIQRNMAKKRHTHFFLEFIYYKNEQKKQK